MYLRNYCEIHLIEETATPPSSHNTSFGDVRLELLNLLEMLMNFCAAVTVTLCH